MTYKKINVDFGNNLKKIRKTRKIPQDEFAELCNISRAYYGRIERGEHSATIEMCEKIAKALRIHIADLFADLPD